MKRTALLLLLFLLPISADSAVYWIKATVDADVVGTADDFDDPYGLQAGIDALGDNDEARIVCDTTNNYDSNSNSWNNRDADKGIDHLYDAASTAKTTISGWVDETTKCTDWGQANCPCMLDWSSGTVTADPNFLVQGDRTVIQGIHFKGNNTNLDEVVMSQATQVWWYRVEVSNGGEIGIWFNGGNHNGLVESRIHDNDAQQVRAGPTMFIYGNQIEDPDSTSPCLQSGSHSFILNNTITCPEPGDSDAGADVWAYNTIRGTSGPSAECIVPGSGHSRFIGNIFEGCTDAIDYGATMVNLSLYNVFNSVTNQLVQTNTALLDPGDEENNNGDTTDCELPTAPDASQTACTHTIKSFGDSGGSDERAKGAMSDLAGRGGGSSIGLMGTR